MKITGMDVRTGTDYAAGTVIEDILKRVTTCSVVTYIQNQGWILEHTSTWESIYRHENPDDKKDFFVLQLPGERQRQSNPCAFMEPLERIALVEDTTFLVVVCRILKVDHLILYP